MGTLDADRLITIIDSGRGYGQMGVDDNILDQLINKAREEKLVFSSESSLVTKLRNFISEPLTAIKTERKELFDKYDLFVLPNNICICLAEPGNNSYPASIVLSTGMINLIGSSHFAAHVDDLVPAELSTFYSLQYPQFPVTRLFATLLFLFRYRCFRYAEPMPDFSSVIAKDKFEDLLLMIAGTITTLLLHELGHHELGHLETEKSRSMTYEMVVHQSLNDYQRQEAEADGFALESGIAEAYPLLSYWLEQNLDFFIQLELMSGLRDQHHPLAINRALNAGILRQGDLSKFGLEPEHPKTHREKLAEIFLSTENAINQVENRLLQTSRETCYDALKDVSKILKSLDIDIAPLLDKNSRFDCLKLYPD